MHHQYSEQQCSMLRSMLRNLQGSVDGIEAAAVVSRDGITIASHMPQTDTKRFGAMCAALMALSDRAGQEVELGKLRQIILDGSSGPMLLTHAGDRAVCAVSASAQTNLGRLILETRKLAKQIANVLSAPTS